MGFYLNRYIIALAAHKMWALLIVVMVGLYLFYAALTDVRYIITQDFSPYFRDIPVAESNSPIGTVKLSDVVTNPDLLFLDGFALAQLQQKLGLLENTSQFMDNNQLRRSVHSVLTLSEGGEAKLRLSFAGKDPLFGRVLVAFYTDRLMKRIDDGLGRTKSKVTQVPVAFQPTGDIKVISEKSLWRPDRLMPAIVVLMLSVLAVMVLIAIFELSDQTFKSERQMARYLGLPVIGMMPDAETLVRNLSD